MDDMEAATEAVYFTSTTNNRYVVCVTSNGVEQKTLKESAIEEIKEQPYYK